MKIPNTQRPHALHPAAWQPQPQPLHRDPFAAGEFYDVTERTFTGLKMKRRFSKPMSQACKVSHVQTTESKLS